MKAYAYSPYSRRRSRLRSPLVGALILGAVSGGFSGFGALPMMGMVLVLYVLQQAW